MRKRVIIKCVKEGILSIAEADEMFRKSKDNGKDIDRTPLVEVNDTSNVDRAPLIEVEDEESNVFEDLTSETIPEVVHINQFSEEVILSVGRLIHLFKSLRSFQKDLRVLNNIYDVAVTIKDIDLRQVAEESVNFVEKEGLDVGCQLFRDMLRTVSVIYVDFITDSFRYMVHLWEIIL